MPKRVDMTGQQEVERLDLLCIGLAGIQRAERAQEGWTRNPDLPDRRQFSERDWLAVGRAFIDDPLPNLSHPFPIFAVEIGRVQEMAKPMFRPVVLIAICPFAQENEAT